MRYGWLVGAVPLLLFCVPGLGGCSDAVLSGRDTGDASNVRDFLAGDAGDERYARALEPRPFVFPQDHGAHPEFRTEWWYLTGNLGSDAGRHFGFQLTFFRYALTAEPLGRSSAWATDQLWMAHFAVTDTDGDAFYADEKFERGALGLAGATVEPLRVWLDDWQLRADGDALLPLTLRAATDDVALELRVAPGKPVVLQGDRGLDAKGPEPGNASYYYSYTRLPGSGTLRIGGRDLAVSGSVWMDREWSTSVLGDGVEGWNWFALQLDDGSDLMVYRLRQTDGSTGPFSGGVLVAADGSVDARLDADDCELTPTAWWTSPASGARYAVGWHLAVPERNLALDIAPRLENQELNLTVRYWEGAVIVSGQRGGQSVTGVGYAEHAGVDTAAAGLGRGRDQAP